MIRLLVAHCCRVYTAECRLCPCPELLSAVLSRPCAVRTQEAQAREPPHHHALTLQSTVAVTVLIREPICRVSFVVSTYIESMQRLARVSPTNRPGDAYLCRVCRTKGPCTLQKDAHQRLKRPTTGPEAGPTTLRTRLTMNRSTAGYPPKAPCYACGALRTRSATGPKRSTAVCSMYAHKSNNPDASANTKGSSQPATYTRQGAHQGSASTEAPNHAQGWARGDAPRHTGTRTVPNQRSARAWHAPRAACLRITLVTHRLVLSTNGILRLEAKYRSDLAPGPTPSNRALSPVPNRPRSELRPDNPARSQVSESQHARRNVRQQGAHTHRALSTRKMHCQASLLSHAKSKAAAMLGHAPTASSLHPRITS